jgi:hypothetical protein
MIHNRRRIHYLLIVCIALTPMLNVDAFAAGHMAPMSTTDTGCDMHGSADHGFCDNTHCLLLTGACGAHGSAGYLPEIAELPNLISPLVENRPCGTTRFRSQLVSSIYRPPIS